MPERATLQPGQIMLRHVQLGASTDPGAVEVHEQWMVPSWSGINGPRGFVYGEYERRVNDEGRFTLRFPNAAGEDGVLHRERFQVISRGRRSWTQGSTFYTVGGGTYRPGDEWIEIYRVSQFPAGDLLFVGTPTSASVTTSTVEIAGVDALWLLKKQRDTAVGIWCHAPHDVFAHYTSGWLWPVADPFDAESRFTFGTNFANTADGAYKYIRCENGSVGGENDSVRMRPNAANTSAIIHSLNGHAIGTASSEPYSFWRVEATIKAPLLYIENATSINVALTSLDETETYAMLTVRNESGTFRGFWNQPHSGGFVVERPALAAVDSPGPYRLVIEGRDRWIFYFINGALAGQVPMPAINKTAYPIAWIRTGATDTSAYAYLQALTFRHSHDLLMDRDSVSGDRDLPGLVPSGGLSAQYYSESFEAALTAAERDLQRFTVANESSRRQDPTIDLVYNAAQGSNRLPPGPGSNFSVRWTGAIYLDLATADIALRVAYYGTVTRVWVGKTFVNQVYLANSLAGGVTNVAGGSLRTHLGTQENGWYPIIVEYAREAEATYQMKLEGSYAPFSAWSTVPSTSLSPLGIFEHAARFDSFGDHLREVLNTYALQFVVEPKQLESGHFPGQVLPRTRVGRDTEKIIDAVESSSVALQINAEEVCDILVADAQGLADPRGVGQLTVEAINFDELGESHFIVHQEYDSMADVGILEVADARVNTLLALRGSAWEQASTQPVGQRELLDTFPLTGAAAEFAWEPGDGVRIQIPEVGIEDPSPRQILGVSWSIAADGLGRPSVSFRQRPRSVAEMIRSLKRESLQQVRNYQTQFVKVTGSVGVSPTSAAQPDPFTRVALPEDLSRVVLAEFVCTFKAEATSRAVQINGTSRFNITIPGRYDVTPWVAYPSTSDLRMYAQVLSAAAATEYMLELTVRV